MATRISRLFFAIAVLSACSVARATDVVWVIGGGPDIDDAGVQIEYNVGWLLGVIDQIPGDRDVRLYFGAGGSGEKDVLEWSIDTVRQAKLGPIARVFGNEKEIGETYRVSNLGGIRGATNKNSLTDSLRDEFSKLGAGDRAFIIYNGHGGKGDADAGDNTLRLWGNTSMTAREFESLLNSISDTVPTRFLVAQCYSGGFARLVRRGGDDNAGLSSADRCGFFAASHYQQSEGCSPSVATGDYRDYTTHFFAAYSGITRQGQGVLPNQDLDGDGLFTPFDAHLHALTVGYSRSVPRSTSEVYLERWQPWYLRWLYQSELPDNVYGRLSRTVASAQELPDDDSLLIDRLSLNTHSLKESLALLELEQKNDRLRIAALQVRMRKDVGWRWPESRSPYTDGYVDFLEYHIDKAQLFITSHELFPELVELQDRQITLDSAILKHQRDIVDLEKVRRLRNLSRILSQFERYASDNQSDEYSRLKSCETSTF